MKRVAIGLMVLMSFGSSAFSQEFIPADDPRLRSVELSGEEAQLILTAWTALEARYENGSALSDFQVRLLRMGDGPATISFFKPNTIIRRPDGSSTIREDSRYYPVVVGESGARVFPDGTTFSHDP